MSNSDPGLIGLFGDLIENESPERSERPAGDDRQSSDAELDPVVDTAEAFLSRMGQRATDATTAAGTIETTPEQSTQENPVDESFPKGAILANSGQPFTDFDSAHYAAAQISEVANATFIVQAVRPDQFVVVRESSTSPDLSEDKSVDLSDDLPQDDRLSYLSVPINELQLTDFPTDHPVHKCGLGRYKRYMKKNFRFKPAYRSMLMLLALILTGGMIYLFPIPLLNLLPRDVVQSMVAAVPPDKLTSGVSVFGAMLAVAAAGRVLWDRHVRRYMLMPGYAKMEYGIISRHSTKILYTNIVDYDTKQSIIGRLLNYGTIELSSAGSDGSEIEMRNLFAPRLVECVIEGKMEEAKRKSR